MAGILPVFCAVALLRREGFRRGRPSPARPGHHRPLPRCHHHPATARPEHPHL